VAGLVENQVDDGAEFGDGGWLGADGGEAVVVR
jgi:hypothetical protein